MAIHQKSRFGPSHKPAQEAPPSQKTGKKKKEGTFTKFDICFKGSRYKIIRSVRAFNEESLIGNLGGYVGLFLGVAIWQAPDIIGGISNKIKYCFSRALQ